MSGTYAKTGKERRLSPQGLRFWNTRILVVARCNAAKITPASLHAALQAIARTHQRQSPIECDASHRAGMDDFRPVHDSNTHPNTNSQYHSSIVPAGCNDRNRHYAMPSWTLFSTSVQAALPDTTCHGNIWAGFSPGAAAALQRESVRKKSESKFSRSLLLRLRCAADRMKQHIPPQINTFTQGSVSPGSRNYPVIRIQ